MELSIPIDSGGPKFDWVVRHLRDTYGMPIGKASDNPILGTRIYEVEYPDGHKASLTANDIAENLFLPS